MELGLQIKWGKIIGPITRVAFLELIIDSVLQRIELPLEELATLSKLYSRTQRVKGLRNVNFR